MYSNTSECIFEYFKKYLNTIKILFFSLLVFVSFGMVRNERLLVNN